MKRVLIIDDEGKLRSLLARIIGLEGFDVLEAGDCHAARKCLEHNEVEVVLCDVKLPDGNGVELTAEIKSLHPLTEVILLTAYGNIADGVQAIKNGAFDYITKGDDNHKIIPLIFRALEKAELARRVQHLEKQLGHKYDFNSIIGISKSIEQAVKLARQVAPADTTVLLNGETGTGKEVFARAIHHYSPRSKYNFVAVNCAAFSKDLLESEMFGHRAGAFTGALKDRKGLFEEAHKGTIFLDEIGEMAPELQAKLLRVLENGEFLKVGDSKPTHVDVRVIAATNRDLRKEAESGHFREDLFYRISVFQITLPPLRERIADIEPLARNFVAEYAAKSNKKISAISSEFLAALKLYDWPGNIRELKNAIERSVILCSVPELSPDTLPLELQQLPSDKIPGKVLSAFELASAEKIHIQKVLNYTNGNKTEAARLLRIALSTLYRKLLEYGIS